MGELAIQLIRFQSLIVKLKTCSDFQCSTNPSGEFQSLIVKLKTQKKMPK